MGSMLKKLFMTVLGTVLTAYVTKTVTEALERKPLKTRVREGKEKAVQLKDTAVSKAESLKSTAKAKTHEAKAAARAKADELIEEDRPVVKVEIDKGM
jgi:hypothetical protein